MKTNDYKSIISFAKIGINNTTTSSNEVFIANSGKYKYSEFDYRHIKGTDFYL